MPTRRKRQQGSRKRQLRLVDYPAYYMAHIVGESQRKIQEGIRPLRVSPNEWRVIFLLHEHGELSISELSSESLIEASTMSRLLKSLESRKLIGRQRHEKDQRYSKMHLTSEGQKIFDKIIPVVMRQLEFTIQGLTATEKKNLLRVLKKMRENAYRSPFAVVS